MHMAGTIARRMARLLALAAAALVLVPVLPGTVATALAAGDDSSAPARGDGPATRFFVSPRGDDRSPGTQRRPVRTLERARQLVRTANRDMTRDIVVLLDGGTYRLARPLALDAADSGTNGHTVIYRALPDQHPVISGGLPVTGWRLVDRARSLWSAPAPAGLDSTRQLYVDGVRAGRARGLPPAGLAIARNAAGVATGYTDPSATMATWRNPADIEFVHPGGNNIWSASKPSTNAIGAWTEPRCPVATIAGPAITMAQPCWDNTTARVKFPPGLNGARTINLVGGGSDAALPGYVENAFELLGTPGQFYLDRTLHTIYYVPRPGEDLRRAEVVAPALETLVSGTGTADDPVHDIAFEGLQFSYATWLQPNGPEGFSEIQANFTLTGPGANLTQGLCQLPTVVGGQCPFAAWTQAHANLSFTYDRSIRFQDDAFVHLGAAGLSLGDGSQSDVVRGSVFTDISGNGLEIGNVDLVQPAPGEATSGNQVLDNHLYDLPVEYHGGVAILNGYTENDLIQHNQIDHTSYTAISMGWGGWLDKIKMAAQPNPSHDNVVADNLIFDQMQVLADGGAIYTQGITGSSLATGEKVTGNVIHDQYGSGHAIYTDNGATYETIRDNVIAGINFDNWGSRHTDYRPGATDSDPTDIENNYWQQGDADSSTTNVTLKGNHVISRVDQAPRSILENAGLRGEAGELLERRFSAPSAPEAPSHVAAFAGDGFAYVSWNPPVFEGTSPVESYTVTSSHGDHVTVSARAFLRTAYVRVPGLTDGTAYTFTVAANNEHGRSRPSLPSAAVTPAVPAVPVTVPLAPQSISARAGDGMVSVHFKDPSASGVKNSDGGSPVISYTITASPGGRKLTFTGRDVLTLGSSHSTFAVLDGLKNGQAYTLTVTADNAAGSSPPASVVVTPGPAPAPSPPGSGPPTVVLDGGALAASRQRLATDGQLQSELVSLVAAANQDLTAGPWSVMDKSQLPPSGDRHDYLSQAPYWWPGANGGCPYVQRDGQRNPAADAIPDHGERGTAWQAAYDLSLAWYYTGDVRYAQRAELVLRTWFLDPATRMNPNFQFAQIIPCPGQTHLGVGIIESSEQFGEVLDAAALLSSGAPGWSADDQAGMRSWVAQFQTWLQTSPDGQHEAAATNNHGSWFDAQAAAIALFLGQTDAARAIVQGAETGRIAVQVAADGSQPLEMRRTLPWHYSNFNARALCRLAATGQHVGVNLWAYTAPGGGSLDRAVDFLLPAAEHGQSAWPAQEHGPFDQSEALRVVHAAADAANANDAAARAAIPLIPAPPGGDTWTLVPAC
jgi:hypothetical protein